MAVCLEISCLSWVQEKPLIFSLAFSYKGRNDGFQDHYLLKLKSQVLFLPFNLFIPPLFSLRLSYLPSSFYYDTQKKAFLHHKITVFLNKWLVIRKLWDISKKWEVEKWHHHSSSNLSKNYFHGKLQGTNFSLTPGSS